MSSRWRERSRVVSLGVKTCGLFERAREKICVDCRLAVYLGMRSD